MTNGFTTMELRYDNLITMRHGPSREKMRGEKKNKTKTKNIVKKPTYPYIYLGIKIKCLVYINSVGVGMPHPGSMVVTMNRYPWDQHSIFLSFASFSCDKPLTFFQERMIKSTKL